MARIALSVRFLAAAAALALGSCGGGGGGGGGAAAPAAGAGGGAPPAQLAPTRPKTGILLATEGEGFLEDEGGKLVLHVKGTPYERGFQYGALVGDRVEDIIRILPGFLQSQKLPSWIVPSVTYLTARLFEPYFPPDVQDYIRGIVDGNRARRPATAFLGKDDIILMTSLVDLGGVTDGFFSCSSIAAWGPHTVGGKMFQTRCVDLFTGSGLENHTLVCIEKGEGKVPFANCGWTGMLGAISGMNAHGIGVGQVWAFSQDRAFGTPWGLTTRRIMEEGVNADDALRIFAAEQHRTYGSNFVFGDRGDGRGGVPRAYAIESSAHFLATFADNDPAEDNAIVNTANGPACYAIKIPFAVFRGDCCLDPGMRSRQTAAGGPAGDPRGANSYQRRYKGQADALARLEQGGAHQLDAYDMIALTRDVATPGGSVQCCVYGNSDLEFWVADAALPAGSQTALDAFTQPYVHHDLDYYLPTVHATLDRADYLAGERGLVTLSWETLGRDRDLWLMLAVEGAGGTYYYAEAPGPIPLSFRTGAPRQSTALAVTTPAAPPGAYRLVARLYERGTADLVDISIAPLTIR
jgi:hypothetical protein